MKKASGFNKRIYISARRSFLACTRIFCLLLAALMSFSCGDDATQPDVGPGGYSIRPEALWTTGVLRTDAQGSPIEWMLPSSQRITPFAVEGARLLEIDDFTLPLGLAIHPTGKHIILTTAGGGRQALLVINAISGAITARVDGDYFLGLAFRPPDGSEVYVSAAGRNLIETYSFDEETGNLNRDPTRSMPLNGFAGGLCVSPDGNLLLAVSQFTGGLTAFDLQANPPNVLGSAETGQNPYTVIMHPGGREAYVSCERSNEVNIFDISDPANILRTKVLPTQKNPEALLLNQEGTRLYVTNADQDSVSILDVGTAEPRVLDTMDLRSTPGLSYGSSPNALAFSPATQRLYIAQAGLNKLAVLDIETGAHLGDIPTGWYPTAVVLHAEESKKAGQKETLFVANGKGVGTPWKGDMGHVPGRISILPVPADSDLEALSREVEENNAFPGRLFDIHPGAWTNPIPRTRGGPTPIKYVFLVIRENKTYDYLLGPYQPARGHAEGDPSLVMDEYETILPNLYALVKRFGNCDNYYSNAQASNQGHELLTSSTVNTYVEKLVFADDRPVPFQLEMFANEATWPMKDFIFQNALRNGISFRDYGEAVGMGKDLLLLDEQYVHWSLHDPPWFHMFSQDERKIQGRISEWESEQFSGPNFPRLIFMLLPDDHTFGDRFLFPTYKSMVADNDFATGLFVDWLSRSPYWMESVAFITEDDPQQGVDHIDPHRTLMLAVSPWVKRGYVSHVRYNEANLYATLEYILGLPPLTLFDEIAQPMYDLFTSSADAEEFDRKKKEYPWRINLTGTMGSRRTAEMYFAEPDEAEGLMEVQLAMEVERKEAKKLTRRIREKAARLWYDLRKDVFSARDSSGGREKSLGPVQVLQAMVELAEEGDRETFEGFLDNAYKDLYSRYREKKEYLDATIMPRDPVGELFSQFGEYRPRPVSLEAERDAAQVDVVYTDGVSSRLRFRKEGGEWKFDFSHHFAPTVRILSDSALIKETFEVSKALRASSQSGE